MVINKEYEFVVIGGGLAGMTAAIAAARNGVKTALINNRSLLGGNASSEVGIDINGACYNSLYSPSVYARETGIIEQLKLEIFHRAGYEAIKSPSYDGVFFDLVYNEKNIDLYLNTQAISVEKKDNRIESVTCVQLGSEKTICFKAPIFADCTGDATIGALAGAQFMIGSEGFDEYNESLAHETACSITSGSTLMFKTVNTGKPEKFIAPDFAYDITELPFFNGLGSKHRTFYRNKGDGQFQGFWWVEYGGHLDTITDNEEITFELRKIVYGLWDYIKNSGEFEGVENDKLVAVNTVIGKRESRRLIGDFILSQNDIVNKRYFEDACYVGGWPMDIHADKGIYDNDVATHWNYVPGMFNVPLRTLYSKNIDNLFMAGRNTSCTRVGNSSTRVMATCSAGGQAVGVAAWICIKEGLKPRDVYAKKIDLLQKTLIQMDQTIMGYKEDYGLQNVKCVASSVKNVQNTKVCEYFDAEKNLVIAFPLSTQRLEQVEVYLKNFGKQTTLKYAILTGKLKECYLPEEKVGSFEISVKQGFEGFLTLPVKAQKGEDDKIYLLFYPNTSIKIGVNDKPITGIPTFTCWEKIPDVHDARKYYLTRQRVNIAFKNLVPSQEIFGVENVISGYNRPYGMPNIWISEGTQEGEFLSLEFKSKKVEQIEVVLNTALEEDIIYSQPKQTLKDYDLEVQFEDEIKIFNVRENYMRINRFEINGVIKGVKIIPLSNYGADDFEIFGIKFY